MAYFLKKSTLKRRTYLSIVESFYSHDKRGAAHRTYKSLASVETWKAKGIEDPVAYFQKQVDLKYHMFLLNVILATSLLLHL